MHDMHFICRHDIKVNMALCMQTTHIKGRYHLMMHCYDISLRGTIEYLDHFNIGMLCQIQHLPGK